ncbi:MAG: nuclear transport factor 2 family protein [Pseudomonadota bacterium]
MKLLILGMMLMTITATNPASASSSQDNAAIKTIVESVAHLADTGNFEDLEKLYADEIEVDYTSLAGGEVELKSPQALMTQWASILPGFDRTHHQLSNISIKINGDQAIVTADVIADHYVSDLFWQVSGHYLYKLEKETKDWQITSHTFNFTDEQGTRDVFNLASENATANPVSYILRQKAEQ